MDSVIVQSGLTFVAAAALATYVALQRQRTLLHTLVLFLLMALMAWTGGLIGVYAAHDDETWVRAAALLVFAGVMSAPPLWLFLCARLAGVPAVVDRPVAALFALLVPTFLGFASVATDDLHGLFAGGENLAVFRQTPQQWAGPLFWVHALWGSGCVLGGITLCIRAALRAEHATERTRLFLVACAAAVPLLSQGVILSGVLPSELRVSPADLTVSTALLVAAIVGYRVLETSSLNASEVIAHLREGFVVADEQGRVVDANPAATSLLCREAHELRDLSLAYVVRLLGASEAEAQGVEASQPVCTLTLTTPDERMYEVSRVRLTGSRAGTLGSFLVIHDRTDQHRSERIRDRAQRLESLGVLAAGIAHEINNPLAFVRGNLTHLTRLAEIVGKRLDAFEPPDIEALGEMGEVIWETQGGVDRISRIVDATRRLSRESSPRREPVDMNEVADGALQMAAMHANRSVRIEALLCDSLPQVLGSAERLGQVVLNLLINAKQAAGGTEGGRIRIETRTDGGFVEVQVHDDGPGVPVAHRERIFDPFFTTKGPDEGTGLGLAIAFDIAEEHGGQLDVGDSDLGGARFALRVPSRAQQGD